MNQREQLIEDVEQAIREADNAFEHIVGNSPESEDRRWLSLMAQAAVAVFEGAGSFLPVASDVQETAHTDDEREALGEDIQAYLVMDGVYLDHAVTRALAQCLLTDNEWTIHRTVQGNIFASTDSPPNRNTCDLQGELSDAQVVDIANRAQEETGRSIWPSTVRAVLRAAAETGGEHRG